MSERNLGFWEEYSEENTSISIRQWEGECEISKKRSVFIEGISKPKG